MTVQLQLIYLIYGAAFFFMGAAVLTRVVTIQDREISRSFAWLGWFGLLHGLSEWSLLPAAMAVFYGNLYPNLIFAALSFCALLQFGCTLGAHQSSHLTYKRTVVTVLSLTVVCGLLFVEGPALREYALRMLLGVPATAFATFALFLNRTKFSDPNRNIPWIVFTSATFLLYGILTSVSPADSRVPNFAFSQSAFEALFGFPVQIARAALAVLVTGSLCASLKVIDRIEKRTLLKNARKRTQSLKQSEENFRKLFEYAGIGMMLIDGNGVILNANRSLEKMLGYSKGSLVGLSLFELTHPEDNSLSRDVLVQWSGHGSNAVRLQKRYVTKSGETIWAQVTVAAIAPSEDRRPMAVSQVEDITERKRVEQALKQSEARSRELLENSPMGVAVVQHKTDGGTILAERLFANKALADMFGFATLEDLIDNDISNSWINQDALQHANRAMLNGEDLVDFEAQRRRIDGVEIWISMNSRRIRFDGKPCTVIWHFDITERKLAETALRQSQYRLIEAQRIAKLGSWDMDLVSGQLNWSEEACRIFEIDPAISATSFDAFLDIIHSEDRDAVERAYKESLCNRTPFDNKHRLLMKDGCVKWVQERCETDFDDDGNPFVSRGTVQDITEQRAAETKIIELNENLEQRVEERTRALQEAQAELVRNERLATLGRLSATVSHELRNPLGTIRASLFSVRQTARECNADIEQAAARIERNIDRCGLIIDEMLVYARARPPERVPTNVEQWLEDVLAEQTIPRDVHVDVDHDPELRSIEFDPESMLRAVTNLIDNACHALSETSGVRSKKLAIRTDLTGDTFAISVSDNGPGIEPHVLANIFEPLYSTKSFGIGLGLPIVRQIAESHGGTLDVESDPGHGTRAILRLPVFKNVIPISTVN